MIAPPGGGGVVVAFIIHHFLTVKIIKKQYKYYTKVNKNKYRPWQMKKENGS